MSTEAPTAAPQVTPYPPLGPSLWMMSLMFLGAVLYNVDRQIIGVLAEQIRSSIGVSDVQMSLLIGLAYSAFGGVFGIFLGFFIDRSTRYKVVAAALAIWSLATLVGGLSHTFGHLFLSRAVVGLGEACLAPAVMSLIADIFPPGQRGKALAAYSFGATIGAALANAIPGYIVGHNVHLHLPLIGALEPWRTTFVLCGLVGPIVALAVWLTCKEPPRQGVMAARGGSLSDGLKANFRYLGDHASVFIPYLGGFGMFYVGFLGILSWQAVFLQRTYHMSLGQIGGVLGLTMLGAGMVGYIIGGLLYDSRALRPTSNKFAVMGLMAIIAIGGALAVLAPNFYLGMGMVALVSLVAPIINVANGAVAQDIMPNDMRAFVLSLCSVMSSIFGFASGPLLVALVTSQVFKDPAMIGHSFLVVCVPAFTAAAVCYLLAWNGVRHHTARGSLIAEVMRAADALSPTKG